MYVVKYYIIEYINIICILKFVALYIIIYIIE